MPPVIVLEKCTSAGDPAGSFTCAAMCPGDVIHIDKEKNIPIVLYPDECCHCGNCRISCHADAIRMVLPIGMRV
jgi:NAD-dependent dihydropyrimidine dehydrogenase PreA subunit